MHHLCNKDMLLTVPTLELRQRSLNPRLRKIFRETAVLAELVSSANRDDLIEYGAGAKIIKAGANSPDSMRSDHLPYVGKDEVDAYPWDVGGEGDPNELIANRQRTFTRAKTYEVSTPTVEGASHIDNAYQASDRRRYHVPCPHCGHLHVLAWRHFQYKLAPGADHDDPAAEIGDAWMACPDCGAKIEEHHKPQMLAGGRWIAERPRVKRHRGYHLNALYAPIGLGLRWVEIAAKWRAAQGDTAKLKAFTNTQLGEVWREAGESIADIPLITRLEDYRLEDLLAALVAGGVDVQADRLELTAAAWGPGEEGWALDHLILPGDTQDPDTWEQLEPAMRDLGVEIACIDAGYRPDMVRAFCAPRSWCIPTKGMPGTARPIIQDERQRRQRLRLRRKRGQPVEPHRVDQAKSRLYARLKLQEARPGYLHFRQCAAFDDCAQLGAEKLVKRIRKGRVVQEWIQTAPATRPWTA